MLTKARGGYRYTVQKPCLLALHKARLGFPDACTLLAAHKRADGSMDWGKCSEESHYATAGKSPAAESASAASSDASRKGKKREAAVRKEERRPQQPAPSKSQELSEEAEQQRLQVCLPVLTAGNILQVA